MRDPNRIKPLLQKLQAYWLQHPDLRLGQIISLWTTDYQNMRNASWRIDPFYLEDEEFSQWLSQQMKK